MALITSHILNSVNGTHAANIAVELIRICQSGQRETLLQTSTDEGGRVSENVSLPDPIYATVSTSPCILQSS